MIFSIFLFWRISLFLVTALGSLALEKVDNGAMGSIGQARDFNYWASWAQWDGGHYYQIASKGYAILEDYAFFPLYPFLTKATSVIFFNNLLLTGLVISNLMFFLFLLILYKYVKRKYNHKVAVSTLGVYLAFPTSFFAVSFYSESLFLALAIAVFYFLHSKKFLLGALCISLSSVTRLVGIALAISIFYSYFSSIRRNLPKIDSKILHIIPTVFGFSAYSLFLFTKSGDPFKYLTSQSLWERSITDPISTILSYIWTIITRQSRPINDYFDLLATLFFLIVLAVGAKKISASLWIFSMLVILIPASTGTLTSMPRYVLASLGAFVILGQLLEENPHLKLPLWATSLFLQA